MSIYDTIRTSVDSALSSVPGLRVAMVYRRPVVDNPGFDVREGDVEKVATEDFDFEGINNDANTVFGVRRFESFAPGVRIQKGDTIVEVINLDLGFVFEVGNKVQDDAGDWRDIIALAPAHDSDQVVVRNLLLRRR